MDVVYKKLNALMTPEALAQLGEAKIIFESTNQDKLKRKILHRCLRRLWFSYS